MAIYKNLSAFPIYKENMTSGKRFVTSCAEPIRGRLTSKKEIRVRCLNHREVRNMHLNKRQNNKEQQFLFTVRPGGGGTTP